MDLFSLLTDLLMFYVFFRFCKWILGPYIFSSPFQAIPGPSPQSWFMGNLGQLFNSKGLPFHQELVDRFGGMVKVYGFFRDEQLYVSDPRALQSIVLKDQDAFEETAVFTDTNKVIFGPGLVATTGEQHRRQRKLVNPVFSASQLRHLTPTIYDIADKLADVLDKQINHSSTSNPGEAILDMSEWMSRVALETVGQAVLGYSFDPLNSSHNNPYTSAVKELIPTLFSLAIVRQFAPFLIKLGPPWFRRKLVEWTPNKAVQRVKEMSDVMHETAQSILQQKKKEITFEDSASNSKAKDIISLLLHQNNNAASGQQMNDSELTGQMTVLIFGAQDTTSSALSRILYLFSVYPEIQETVRREIREALRRRREYGDASERLGYDEIMALPWMDAVIKETLRLYPPVPFVRRTAVKERTIPYSPDSSGGHVSTVTIPVGTTLFISIIGSNRLESIWGPDASVWRPERWMSDDAEKPMNTKHPEKRLPGIYSGMMSFFGGGRSCVGYKFAQLEMKIILVTLLSRFTFQSTNENIVWNLSQIISPSVRTEVNNGSDKVFEERKGLPLIVRSSENVSV